MLHEEDFVPVFAREDDENRDESDRERVERVAAHDLSDTKNSGYGLGLTREYTKSSRAHTHTELIREWRCMLKGALQLLSNRSM